MRQLYIHWHQFLHDTVDPGSYTDDPASFLKKQEHSGGKARIGVITAFVVSMKFYEIHQEPF